MQKYRDGEFFKCEKDGKCGIMRKKCKVKSKLLDSKLWFNNKIVKLINKLGIKNELMDTIPPSLKVDHPFSYYRFNKEFKNKFYKSSQANGIFGGLEYLRQLKEIGLENLKQFLDIPIDNDFTFKEYIKVITDINYVNTTKMDDKELLELSILSEKIEFVDKYLSFFINHL